MAWWQEALCAIGLATCAPPQPDVSAHTILILLIQSGVIAEIFPLALVSLYETVELQATGAFALGRDGQIFAVAACKAPLNCTFQYRDTVQRAQSFAMQAEIWAEHTLGPLETISDTVSRVATPDLEIVITRTDKTVALVLR